MSGELVGLIIGALLCIGVLVAVHLGLKKATAKKVEEKDIWDEVYRREEEIEYPEVFKEIEQSDNSRQIPSYGKETVKKFYVLSKLSKKIRDEHSI